MYYLCAQVVLVRARALIGSHVVVMLQFDKIVFSKRKVLNIKYTIIVLFITPNTMHSAMHVQCRIECRIQCRMQCRIQCTIQCPIECTIIKLYSRIVHKDYRIVWLIAAIQYKIIRLYNRIV